MDVQDTKNIGRIEVPADPHVLEMLYKKHQRMNPRGLYSEQYKVTRAQFGSWECELVCFDSAIKYEYRGHGPAPFGDGCTTETALDELKRLGKRPGALGHLLMFAEKYPKERFKYPIVALGSAINMNTFGSSSGDAPFLCDDKKHFGRVGLGWFSVGWSPACRFLVVRKITAR